MYVPRAYVLEREGRIGERSGGHILKRPGKELGVGLGSEEPLEQSLAAEDTLLPRGHLALSGDIFSCHNLGGVLLASSG